MTYLTPTEAAQYMKISRTTLYKLFDLPYSRVGPGKRRRYSKEVIDKYMKKNETEDLRFRAVRLKDDNRSLVQQIRDNAIMNLRARGEIS